MTINLGKGYGAKFYRMPDAKGRMYLCAVIWFLRGPKQLGYLYPAIRWL